MWIRGRAELKVVWLLRTSLLSRLGGFHTVLGGTLPSLAGKRINEHDAKDGNKKSSYRRRCTQARENGGEMKKLQASCSAKSRGRNRS